ncbi:molybdopterin-guanine dinucleotide biosynthesis protein A [Chitinophaga sp. CF118]|uniref:molybdenum cofactor guanylyltransferase n=1 Tax=Chitinophaga sp. CF118 TaxID=1884367 RepID=UPI0008E336F5|nr:NTP transferase domain-containing protein [Chitinophaga sp. CF118]SFD25162.1 molybdopterin-guanine dinucleotide biosynthesis protein A [Chitinophaga sp. CF118]
MKGLILCGGHSTRMQQDKSNIAYHGMPQWQYLYTLLQSLIPEVYLSCRADQQPAFTDHIPVITDSIPGGGPAVGLLSAHAAFPDSAWLVLACDLPLISLQSLRVLVDARQPEKDATAFISPFNNFPEPLIAIWEPTGLQLLKQSFESGKNCPRKALMQGNIHLLENPYAAEQFNANTPEEMQEAKDQIL